MSSSTATATSSFPVDNNSNQDIDHRKKRRNRTTHSCINCHTTKRKCDRKRPCSRCTQLGLTGLCVYEVDDPNVADDPNLDEITRARKRIAELEGVIRELKNKPHPRWATQSSPDTPASFHTRSQHSRISSSSTSGVKKRKLENGEEVIDVDSLSGGVGVGVGAGPSSAGSGSIKMEHFGDAFAGLGVVEGYTLPDSFRLPSEEGFSSPNSADGADMDSPRAYRFPPLSPVACECLANQHAHQCLCDLDAAMRSAINVLAGVRHTPLSPGAAPDERCVLYTELARLQELISQSTRHASLHAMPAVQHVPTIAQPSPAARGGPLTVSVPLSFQASISSTVPESFNLRPPPPPPSHHHYGAASASAPHTPNGLITPPLSSHSGSAHPWDTYSAPANSPSPMPIVGSHGSPALSAASSGSSAAYVPSVQELERDALSSLVGMGAASTVYQQQPQFYAPQPAPHHWQPQQQQHPHHQQHAQHPQHQHPHQQQQQQQQDYDMTPSGASSFDFGPHHAYAMPAAAY